MQIGAFERVMSLIFVVDGNAAPTEAGQLLQWTVCAWMSSSKHRHQGINRTHRSLRLKLRHNSDLWSARQALPDSMVF